MRRTLMVFCSTVGIAMPCALASQSGTVTPWAPAGISSPLFESHTAFDPRTGDILFVRSTKDFSGWHILESRCGASGWSARDGQYARSRSGHLESRS